MALLTDKTSISCRARLLQCQSAAGSRLLSSETSVSTIFIMWLSSSRLHKGFSFGMRSMTIRSYSTESRVAGRAGPRPASAQESFDSAIVEGGGSTIATPSTLQCRVRWLRFGPTRAPEWARQCRMTPTNGHPAPGKCILPPLCSPEFALTAAESEMTRIDQR